MPILNATVPALLWLWLAWHLHFEWSLSAQYNYGWAVPFLAAWLFYFRWRTRPQPGQPLPANRARFLACGILLAFLPLRLVEEANPDWRLLSWIFALLVVAFSLLALVRAGGWQRMKHFAFPVCFPLVAVPWLVQIENIVVHGLTRTVAYVAVEVAGWIGIGAYQRGNVIQLANGFVGVDEACSGVKTLQAAIMVSLFLGELLTLRAARRVALVLLGCGWVFACNVLRATALVIIAARHGIPALEHWHDWIGSAVLVLGMGGLVAFSFALSDRDKLPARAATDSESRAISFGVTAAAVAWLAFVFVSTELWYRAHERRLITRPPWEAHWPQGAGAKTMPIADTTASILRYNSASSAAWTGLAREEWWGFFARWEPKRAALQLVRSHSPEICLPAVGRTFVRELPPLEFNEGALHLPFRTYEFVQEDRPLFVFVCIQEDKTSATETASGATEWSTRGRLLAVWNGERNLGQRLLELAVMGLPDYPAAREALLQASREIVRPAVTTD